MRKLITLLLSVSCFIATSQNKKQENNKQPAVVKPAANQAKAWEDDPTSFVDTTRKPEIPVEIKLPKEFMVYTKKAVKQNERMKLCFNLVNGDSVLNFCFNDSICKEPETKKVLFNKQVGDTAYMLIYVDAFSKAGSNFPQCLSGKETKLVYVRWNMLNNKAKWRQKTICSCMRNITNMTTGPIHNWDGNSPLIVSYYKGGSDFPEIKFDPNSPQLGLQGDNE